MKINKLVEEITNFDNLKDPKTVIDAVTGDAIETSKEAQDKFDKVAKPFKKPILGKKGDEKSPAQDLDEGFSTDGWELENDNLSEILDELGRVKYEIDNCVRGSYTTHADTYTELARYIIELANDLIDAANDLADGEVSEDDGWDKWEVESSGDMDEALKKSFDFSNGSLRDFDPADLMDKVKKRQMSLFSSREFGDKLYDISIHPHGRVDDPTDIWVDIVSEDLDGNQERIFLKKFLTYDDAINAMNEWKKSMLDSSSAVEESVKVVNQSEDESLNEDDGRQRRVDLTPEQRAEEKAMAATLFDRVYNELEKDTDGSKNKVNKKASQRYNSEDIATDFDGNIVVYAKDKESLTNAVNVAKAYELKYKIVPGSIRNRAHAFQCVLYIPEE